MGEYCVAIWDHIFLVKYFMKEIIEKKYMKSKA